MDVLIGPLRWIHILAGTLALVVAPVAMLTVKGGRVRRRWGKIYFWLMAVVALTAVVLGLWRPVTFLVLVAVFSFYAAFTGYRVLGQKRPDRGDRPAPLDWIAAWFPLALADADRHGGDRRVGALLPHPVRATPAHRPGDLRARARTVGRGCGSAADPDRGRACRGVQERNSCPEGLGPVGD